jgi:hypothetical protein
MIQTIDINQQEYSSFQSIRINFGPKHILSILLFLFVFIRIGAQDCQSVSTLFTYSTVKNGSKATISFAINSGALSIGCKRSYIWDFGDGTSTSQIVYSAGTYTLQTHDYDLTNTSIVQYGVLQVTVRLRVATIEESYTYGDHDCESTCYTQEEPISYTIPSSDWLITLSAKPYTNDYPLNSPITLVYNISPSNYAQTDNITYSLEKDGTEIITGQSVSEFNKNVDLHTFTPTEANISSYVLVLKRYGNIVGFSSPLTISVASGGSGGGSGGVAGSCLCSQSLKACLDVTTKTENGKTYFTILDCSSAEFKKTFSGCPNYYLWVESGGFTKFFAKDLQYPGTNILATWDDTAPDIYEKPVKYTFRIEVLCHDAKGDKYTYPASKDVVVQPAVFDTSENTIIVKSTWWVTIDTHTPYCKSVVISNPNYPSDNFDWMSEFTLGDDIKFYPKENKSSKDRYAIIKLFVNGNYDKCVDVVDGVKMNYRTIRVFQPTSLRYQEVDKTDVGIIAPPISAAPQNTDHVYVGWAQIYHLSSDNIPVYAGNFETYMEYYDTQGNKIKEDPEDWDPIKRPFSFVFFNCTDNWLFQNNIVPQLQTSKLAIISAYREGNIAAGNCTLPATKSLALFSTEEINLVNNFEVPEGVNFNAGIKSCVSNLKSIDTSEVYQGNEFETPKLVTDSVISEMNILVYPNPSSGYLIVENKTPEHSITSISIINGQGSHIKQITPKSNVEVVDLRGSAPGIYIVKIMAQAEIIYKKIILQVEQ